MASLLTELDRKIQEQYETDVFELSFEELRRIMAGAWDEGYRTNRGKCDAVQANLHNPYLTRRVER